MLKFSPANAKLKLLEDRIDKKIYSFSLLSGHSCPFAHNCYSKVINRKIVDGPNTQFRCFSASQESFYPKTYDAREYNFNLIKAEKGNINNLSYLIRESIPKNAEVIRIHIGGDFYNQSYFDSWLDVANRTPHINYYAYTKSLYYWIARKQVIPKNLVLTASYGGKLDNLISKHRLRKAVVIHDVKTCQAIVDSGNSDIVPCGKYKGYEIDHDDFHAYDPKLKNKSFGLLVHNLMPKGSEASKAVNILNGIGSY